MQFTRMNGNTSLLLVLLVSIPGLVQAWSGNYCSRVAVYYDRRRECSFRIWWICCAWRDIWYPVYYIQFSCCPGWTTSANEVCDVPVCNPPCQNNGVCIAPDQCKCQVQNTGPRCDGSTCSHLAPCYPGTCQVPDSCGCQSGFSTAVALDHAVYKQNYCLQIEDNKYTELQVYQMQVRLSYWPRDRPSEEEYQIMADSTNLNGITDFFWINRKDFNRLETNCSSQFFLPTLLPRPLYISNSIFGIVKGEIEVWLSKLPIPPATQRFQSLNKTFPCTNSVSNIHPESQLYKCDIHEPNFDRFLEHGDFLTITYRTTGGGFREVLNRNFDPPNIYLTQTYLGVNRSLSVQFRFDFRPPFHCRESVPNNCTLGETMLAVPDIARTLPVIIQWNGWQDNDSKMFRYSMEVFKMTKTIDNELEIKPELALKPLINREVMHEALTPQLYTFPEPGMYSIILEAADLANNSKYVRRLCLFDPLSEITTDASYGLYVSSASGAANYTYQSYRNGSIVVTWDQHFRNAFHEANALLGAVREYPRELENSKKTIPINSPLDDNEGQRTIHEIPNKRGIINFQVAFDKDHDGGLFQPEVPTAGWTDVYLNTTFTLPFPSPPSEADTVTIWINATDFLGKHMIERTKVTFDSTPPLVQNIVLNLNAPASRIDFNSNFSISVQDTQSGIAYILWTFTRKTGNEIYRQQVPGFRIPERECTDFKTCSCTTAKECFSNEQVLSLSNCHLTVEKESLATENLTITAHVTNMAGLVTTSTTHKSDLRTLNGTQAYFPPQNINVKSINSEGVTLTWDFPPSCFRRTELWVMVDSDKRVVHKDAVQFDLTGLRPSTNYTIYMITNYEGGETSDPQPFSFRTADAEVVGVSGGAAAGIVIGCLILLVLIIFILMFVLWKKKVFFQQEENPINKGMKRVSTVFATARNTLRRHDSNYDNSLDEGIFRISSAASHNYTNTAFELEAVQPEDDELYLYGNMTFNKKQKWELDEGNLSLVDHITDGRFAAIYKATLQKKGKSHTVVAKMVKNSSSEEDKRVMKAKINFMASRLKEHENVLKFVGAVNTNPQWGPVMVLEYCEAGQLDKWLVAQAKHVVDETIERQFKFSLGIAKAMEFLASLTVTHKRLAARNVLLTSRTAPEVRVTGFGPQEVESDVTHDDASRVPVKWVAPEVLGGNPATEKSDVWSFGVVLWEIFSLGLKPYPEISSREIGTYLKEGHRLPKPEFADDTIYQLMKDCWHEIPSNRPTFSGIKKRLASFYSSGRTLDSVYYDTRKFP